MIASRAHCRTSRSPRRIALGAARDPALSDPTLLSRGRCRATEACVAALAMLARVALAWYGWAETLAGRVELTSPADSVLRLREGQALAALDQSPYAGSMLHAPPLALLLLGPLTRDAPAGLPAVAPFLVADALTAIALFALAARVARASDAPEANPGDGSAATRPRPRPRVVVRTRATRGGGGGVPRRSHDGGACARVPRRVEASGARRVVRRRRRRRGGARRRRLRRLRLPRRSAGRLHLPPVALLLDDSRRDASNVVAVDPASGFEPARVAPPRGALRAPPPRRLDHRVVPRVGRGVHRGVRRRRRANARVDGRDVRFPPSREDLTPNLGLYWYFFAEMFDDFRAFFLCAFAGFGAFLVLLGGSNGARQTVVLRFAAKLCATATAPYPTPRDVAGHLAMLPLFAEPLEMYRGGFLVAAAYAFVGILAPIFWRLWIESRVANSIFSSPSRHARRQHATLCVGCAREVLAHDRRRKGRETGDVGRGGGRGRAKKAE